jgi:cell division protein FtsI (penicillin-binding protein 3)
MFGRLIWLQAVRGGHYKYLAQRQHQQRIGILPERGRIYDRCGRPLALSFDGRRSYPYGSTGAQIMGFVGDDGRGLEGMELLYDEMLQGQSGWTIKQRDATGRTHATLEYASSPAKAGQDVFLTIDAEYQSIADQELGKGAKAAKAVSGAVVISDPATGEILALASYPPFDPNRFRAYGRESYINRAILEQFEPGSTFKIITMAAAIEEKVVAPDDVIDGEKGIYSIGGYKIGEAENHKYGPITASEAIAHSSNICLVKIGQELGKEKLYQYARSFGFGCKTGIEFPGEIEGVMERPDKWSVIQGANISFGQGITVNAIQLTAAYAAVANGGYLIKPRLFMGFSEGKSPIETSCKADTLRRVISGETARKLVAMLEQCVEEGTGQPAAIKGWKVAGKTGTAQKKAKGRKGYDREKYIASFIGFVPTESPRLLVTVIINEPHGKVYGGQVAAPVCRNIMKRIISLPGGFAPDLMANNDGMNTRL